MSMPASSDRRSPGGWRGWLFAYERRHHPLLPWHAFKRRLMVNLAVGGVVIAVSLLVGMAGYCGFEGLNATDSFLNAAMILSGMGPVNHVQSEGGKIFAGLYALYSGLAVLAVAGLVFAPLVHRLLHRFHAEDDADESDESPSTQGKKK
jgi:hypothetical protein